MRVFMASLLSCACLAAGGCLPFGAGAIVDQLTAAEAPEPPAPIIISPPAITIVTPVITTVGGETPTVEAGPEGVEVTPATEYAEPAQHSGTILHEGTIRHEGVNCTYTLPDGRVIDCKDLGDHVDFGK